MFRTIGLIALIISCPALAQTLEDQEHQKRVDEFDSAAKAALHAVDDIAKATKRQCLIAVGNEPLCACLAATLPIRINFIQYVSIITQNKEDLGYEKLSRDDKKIVDLTRASRDKCIANKQLR
jgi:hypothetical protein